MKPVILASASPRRSSLLGNLGIPCVVRPSQCDESCDLTDPEALVCELSRRKALCAQAGDDETVIAADTVVCRGEHILGKPHTADGARAMLRMLSGSSHAVYTGVTVRRGQRVLTRAERTEVFFRDLPDRYIEDYIASGEPFDKAGGYGIQGTAGAFVRRIEGDYFNVMGLPLCTLCQMLEELEAEA